MRYITLLLFIFVASFLFTISPQVSHAQAPILPQTVVQDVTQEYSKAKVIKINEDGKKKVGNAENLYQLITVQLLDGVEKDKQITLEHGGMFTIQESQKVRTGETIIISRIQSADNQTTYRVIDRYRLPSLLFILLLFMLLVVFVAGKKGIGALIGLGLSILVITLFIVPRILAGSDPLFISIIGAIAIFLPTIYLAHGVSQKTTIAVAGTFISLLLTGVLGALFVSLVKLSGLGSEDAYSLQQGFGSIINFQGLLLGGIIIGSLGVLDDVTTTQAATVYALSDGDSKLTARKLFQRGFTVGREHITSVVNTLVLAYAGASIGVFIFLVIATQQNQEPLWMILNSEIIVEEIIRAIAGSIGLILAVPITTLLAAFFVKYRVMIK